jgi:hypothetical protein
MNMKPMADLPWGIKGPLNMGSASRRDCRTSAPASNGRRMGRFARMRFLRTDNG